MSSLISDCYFLNILVQKYCVYYLNNIGIENSKYLNIF